VTRSQLSRAGKPGETWEIEVFELSQGGLVVELGAAANLAVAFVVLCATQAPLAGHM